MEKGVIEQMRPFIGLIPKRLVIIARELNELLPTVIIVIKTYDTVGEEDYEELGIIKK